MYKDLDSIHDIPKTVTVIKNLKDPTLPLDCKYFSNLEEGWVGPAKFADALLRIL